MVNDDTQALEPDLKETLVGRMARSIASRHEAADVLRKVAESGSAGHFPDDVTCEELGQALFRIMMNAPDDDPLTSILKGYRAAELERQERLLDAVKGSKR